MPSILLQNELCGKGDAGCFFSEDPPHPLLFLASQQFPPSQKLIITVEFVLALPQSPTPSLQGRSCARGTLPQSFILAWNLACSLKWGGGEQGWGGVWRHFFFFLLLNSPNSCFELMLGLCQACACKPFCYVFDTLRHLSYFWLPRSAFRGGCCISSPNSRLPDHSCHKDLNVCRCT